ncbi:UNVERIFIED_CONTAM: hypothetical protein FKN15_032199 [Acipenser sinensis]
MMDKSKNFRIDALLSVETHRSVPNASSPGLSGDRPAGSPSNCLRTETPSPRSTVQLQAAIIPKPGLLNLPHPGLTSFQHGAISAMYPAPMYPISALAAQHPAFAYTGFPHLGQPHPEHLKAAAAAAAAGSFPLEHWIRAGIMVKIWFQNRRMKWKRSRKAKEQAAQAEAEKQRGGKPTDKLLPGESRPSVGEDEEDEEEEEEDEAQSHPKDLQHASDLSYSPHSSCSEDELGMTDRKIRAGL